MSKKLSLILIMCLAAVLLLVSCQRSSSPSPVTLPTATHAAGLPTQPANGMGSVQIIGTQTAMAQALLTGSPTPTGYVAIATSTPFGTPVVPPTGAAPTSFIISTPIPGTIRIHFGEPMYIRDHLRATLEASVEAFKDALERKVDAMIRALAIGR